MTRQELAKEYPHIAAAQRIGRAAKRYEQAQGAISRAYEKAATAETELNAAIAAQKALVNGGEDSDA